jgi:hypothetical protein
MRPDKDRISRAGGVVQLVGLLILAGAAPLSGQMPVHEPLQPVRGIDGVFWSVILPAAVLIVAVSSTVALYLHFVRQRTGGSGAESRHRR